MKKIMMLLTVLTLFILSTQHVSGAEDLNMLLNPSPFPIATTTHREMSLSMAFDGTNYLVGIQGDQNHFASVTAQLLSQSGVLIGPRISTGRTGSVSRIAFDGTNYLMVWSDDANHPDDEIYGQFVSQFGTSIGTHFPISTAPGRQGIGSVAFDGTNYFVVWEDERSGSTDVYGQFVSASGVLVDSEIKINTSTVLSGGQMAFDGANYLIVWDSGSSIQGQFLSQNGIPVGSEIFIANKQGNCPGDIDLISIAFDKTNYLVVWNDMSGSCTQDRDIYGAFISPSGSIVGTKLTLSSAVGQQWLPFLAFDGSRYLLTWTDMRNDLNNNNVCDVGEGSCWDIYGQYVSKAGLLVGSEVALNTDAGNQGLSPVLFDGEKYFIVWNNMEVFDGPVSDVYGQFVRKTMFEESDPVITYTGTWKNYNCAACSAGAMKYSGQTGAKVDFSFNGTGIRWIVTKANLLGKARVYLDGVNMGLVDLYNPTAKYQVVLQKTGLAPGSHTITIEVSGLKNTASAGNLIDIDAFEIVP